jgi:hypothetical protein
MVVNHFERPNGKREEMKTRFEGISERGKVKSKVSMDDRRGETSVRNLINQD